MTRVYVGNLPMDVREREVEDFFYKYGRINNVSVKVPPRPPAFAFVTFDDDRDAEDAVRGRDGVDFLGGRIRVELAKAGGRDGGRDRDRRNGPSDRGYGKFSVSVTGLPRSASWQDLKDFGRPAGDIKRSDVFGGGEGVLEYSNESDFENALKTLDDTEFKNRFDKAYVRVRRYGERRRSPSRSRSRSRDRKERDRSNGSDRSDRDRDYRKSKSNKDDDDDDRRSD